MKKENDTLNKSGTIFSGKKAYCWIIGLSVLVYFRSLFFDFTYLDDNALILDSLFFLKDLGNFFRTFTLEVFFISHTSAAYYRPLLTISYMFDAFLGGDNPFLYHLTNVIIHIVNSCLLYFFLKKVKLTQTTSFIFAAVFSVHPVLSQAVSWLPGRNDTLLALFTLASFIFLIDYLEVKKLKHYFLHLNFFALALFTKESAIFLPVIMVIYLYIRYGKGELLSSIFKLIAGWIPIYLLWFFLRSIALAENPLSYNLGEMIAAIFKDLPGILLYLGKIFLPFNLSVLPIFEDSTLVYGIISLVFLLSVFLLSKNKNLLLMMFGSIWFLVFLLPSFIRPDSLYVADFIEHRIYVPVIGLFIVLSEISFIKNFKVNNKVHVFIFTIIIMVLVVVNFIHTTNFKDRITFWKNAVSNSPGHPMAHKNLGSMYYLDGNLDLAEREFRESEKLNPTEPMIHNNLGLIYMGNGDFAKAQEEFAKEISLYPNYDNAYFNWGLVYYQLGEKVKAVEMWLKTVNINPDHTGALNNLAYYYSVEAKDQVKADYYYQEVLKRKVKS